MVLSHLAHISQAIHTKRAWYSVPVSHLWLLLLWPQRAPGVVWKHLSKLCVFT